MIDPDIRRIIAIDAHRRQTGDCPVRLFSLGTGEMFDIEPRVDGFHDVSSGLTVRSAASQIVVPGRGGTIEFKSTGDVTFAGFDNMSSEGFTGRAGGGSTVTIYDAGGHDFFQYAVSGIKTPALADVSATPGKI